MLVFKTIQRFQFHDNAVIAYKVGTKGLGKAMEKALAERKPAFIEVMIDPDDMVFPMCSPGAPLENTFDESDLKVKKDE